MAAKLAGVKTVIVPRLNRRDLVEVPEAVKEGLAFHFVDHMDDVLAIALRRRAVARPRRPGPRRPPAGASPLPPATCRSHRAGRGSGLSAERNQGSEGVIRSSEPRRPPDRLAPAAHRAGPRRGSAGRRRGAAPRRRTMGRHRRQPDRRRPPPARARPGGGRPAAPRRQPLRPGGGRRRAGLGAARPRRPRRLRPSPLLPRPARRLRPLRSHARRRRPGATPTATVATLTLVGTRPADGAWLTRSDARPGQALWVAGTLGESAAGRWLLAPAGGARFVGGRVELPPRLAAGALRDAARRAVRRHLLPAPRLDLGRALGRLARTSRHGRRGDRPVRRAGHRPSPPRRGERRRRRGRGRKAAPSPGLRKPGGGHRPRPRYVGPGWRRRLRAALFTCRRRTRARRLPLPADWHHPRRSGSVADRSRWTPAAPRSRLGSPPDVMKTE